MKQDISTNKKAKDAGFSLIELAIVIMIAGFTMVMGAEAIKLYTTNAKYEKTLEHLRINQQSLNEYVEIYGRYPCPADPTLIPGDPNYGMEMCRAAVDISPLIVPPAPNAQNCNETAGNETGLECTTAFSRTTEGGTFTNPVMIGVVPFRTLAQADIVTNYYESYRLDGYNTQISYAVTEEMTNRFKYNNTNPVNPYIGAIRVEDENDISVVDPDASAHYVVFSHGNNRRGGFTTEGSMIDDCMILSAPLPPPAPPPAPIEQPVGPITGSGIDRELENCDNNDAIFVKGLRSFVNGDNYNDDILFFKARGFKELWSVNLSNPNPGTEPEIYNTNPGNVGVGTDNPTKPLHVVDNLNASAKTKAPEYCDENEVNCLDPDFIAGDGGVCPAGQVATAISENTLICEDVIWTPTTKSCPAGKHLNGFSNKGSIICCDAVSGGDCTTH